MTRIGAIFDPYNNPPEAFRAAVEQAERAGVPELWIWEDCFRQSGFATASAALAWTERLRIGIGIAPMPLRNVALTAMEIATIERMFPGRLLPGVGHGVLEWMAQVGARVASPLTLMREYVPALRGLLAGETVTVSGRYVSLDAVRLDLPLPTPPLVYTAAEGPKTLALSGEVADGTVLDSRHSVDELAVAAQAVRDGRAAAGREGAQDIVAYLVASFGNGSEDRVRAHLGERGIDDDRAVWGEPADAAAAVERLAAVGIDDVILLPAAGEPDLAAFFACVGEVAARVGAEGAG